FPWDTGLSFQAPIGTPNAKPEGQRRRRI
ncbi:MAG: xanthine phosphoribosyltransferase, partial [Methylocystis sp.]